MGTFNSALEEIKNDPGLCKAGEFLFALDEDTAAEYQEAKNNQLYTLRTLYRALMKLGLTTSYETYRHHANGDCRCFATK